MKFSLKFQKYYKTRENTIRALQRRGFYTMSIRPESVTAYRSIHIVEFTKTRKGWKGVSL